MFYKHLFMGLINFFFIGCSALFAEPATSSLTLQLKPEEIYGVPYAPIKIRLSNGGAGPTGLLRALAEDYLHSRHKKFAIAWYKNMSKNTLYELEHGVVDMALAYE